MAVSLKQYVLIKDKYCIGYFGSDTKKIKKLFTVRNLIEKQLPGIKIFIVCADTMQKEVKGKRNTILESNMATYRGQIAYYRILEEKEDISDLLVESNIKV